MITHYEHRALFYSQVENLINPGFITLTWDYGGNYIILRSLYPSDYRFLQEQPESAGKWTSMLIAASTYSINGKRIVDPFYHEFQDLVEMYSALPNIVHNHLLMMVFTLGKRVRESIKSLEPYLYENKSRDLWRYVGSYPSIVCDEFLGIPNLSKFGPNTIQQLWTTWNRSEDLRDQYQIHWGFTKAVLSGLSPKGVKSIDAKDSSRIKQEKYRRETAQTKWLFDILGIRYKSGEDVFKSPGTKTFDDLREEGRKWLTGEKDFHDIIVEDYRNKIAERISSMKEQQAERESLIGEMQDEFAGSGLVAYSPEEIKNVFSGISGVRKISEASSQLQEKWMSPVYLGDTDN